MKCNKCNYTYTNIGGFNECKNCKIVFSNKQNLNRHNKKFHNSIDTKKTMLYQIVIMYQIVIIL